jgi:tRNA C32,U32 (ribose-2'-O)-methylase TrmJ
LEWSRHFPDIQCYYDVSNCYKLTYSRGHQTSNGQARHGDQITRFFTELVEKKVANRAENDRKIEEWIKRLEEYDKAKEKESAILRALLSQVEHRLGISDADNSAREPAAQAKSNNHPSEDVGSPMASNDTTNKGSRKRR